MEEEALLVVGVEPHRQVMAEDAEHLAPNRVADERLLDDEARKDAGVETEQEDVAERQAARRHRVEDGDAARRRRAEPPAAALPLEGLDERCTRDRLAERVEACEGREHVPDRLGDLHLLVEQRLETEAAAERIEVRRGVAAPAGIGGGERVPDAADRRAQRTDGRGRNGDRAAVVSGLAADRDPPPAVGVGIEARPVVASSDAERARQEVPVTAVGGPAKERMADDVERRRAGKVVERRAKEPEDRLREGMIEERAAGRRVAGDAVLAEERRQRRQVGVQRARHDGDLLGPAALVEEPPDVLGAQPHLVAFADRRVHLGCRRWCGRGKRLGSVRRDCGVEPVAEPPRLGVGTPRHEERDGDCSRELGDEAIDLFRLRGREGRRARRLVGDGRRPRDQRADLELDRRDHLLYLAREPRREDDRADLNQRHHERRDGDDPEEPFAPSVHKASPRSPAGPPGCPPRAC